MSTPPRVSYDYYAGQLVESSPTDILHDPMDDVADEFRRMRKDIEELQANYADLLKKYDELRAEKERE